MTRPVPVEIGLPSGLKLRGHEWMVDGPPLLFVHDLGDDLDAWGSTTRRVADAGFRVLSMELRGHGLSDGTPDPPLASLDVAALVHEVSSFWGPVGLVTYGSMAVPAMHLDADGGAPVQCLLSPEVPEAALEGVTVATAMRLVVAGALDAPGHEAAKRVYDAAAGQKMLITTGVDARGPALFAGHPGLVEDVIMFMRRYLTAYHLAWIAALPDRDGEAAGGAEG